MTSIRLHAINNGKVSKQTGSPKKHNIGHEVETPANINRDRQRVENADRDLLSIPACRGNTKEVNPYRYY